jgi:polyferredoxin
LITVNSFVLTALIIVASVFVSGRFFCGYACAFGAMGDWLYAVSAFVFRRFGRAIPRLPVRLVHLLQLLKYLILLAILAACLTGNYRAISGYDPWNIFAALISGNPESVFLFDGWQIAALAFAAIVLGMLFVERFFCQFLCPFGALMALVPALPLLVPGRNQAKCLSGCSACSRSCPASLSLGENHATAGECFQCGRCKTVCPKDNINSLLNKLNSSETAACIVQAAVFAAVIVSYQLG